MSAPLPAVLDYPFSGPPAPGATIEVAPGILWLRMPLPFALDHINLWLLAEADGYTLVDCGYGDAATRALWERHFATTLRHHPVRRIIATHCHPDHVGNAAWLAARFDCPVAMTHAEYLTAHALAGGHSGYQPEATVALFRRHGTPEDNIAALAGRGSHYRRGVQELPASFERILADDRMAAGGVRWHVIEGHGHSPEHACLHCPDLQVFITGDQVLPRITSNVSVFPTEPENDPLSEWLSSLAKLKTRVGDEVLVLPAHNEPFFGLHTRLEHLIDGHERAMDRLVVELAAPKRAVDVFHVLFRRNIDTDQISLATGESIAHLNCLIRRGRVLRERDAAGVNWYRAAA